MMWFDSHCHLDMLPADFDLKLSLNSFASSGGQGFMVPSVGPENWNQVLTLQREPAIEVALGWHPCFIPEKSLQQSPQNLDILLSQLDDFVMQHVTDISALGECGLDGRFPDFLEHQRYLFAHQIELAGRLKLPLIVHSVRCHDQVAQMLRSQQFSQGGVVHGFNGSPQQAARFVDLGFSIGVGGSITWPRSEKTRRAIRSLPSSALLLETDAPDMPLFEMVGDYNTPANIPIILKHLSELRQEDQESLANVIWNNSVAMFC